MPASDFLRFRRRALKRAVVAPASLRRRQNVEPAPGPNPETITDPQSILDGAWAELG